jgi:tetratricopeptide (TPR) repeat protein
MNFAPRRVAFDLSLILFACLVWVGDGQAAAQTTPVTFNHDIRPIIYARCAGCHHPDGPAPFSLVAYTDAVQRARQIAEVTRRRFMPPWRPEAGFGEFVGERRLTESEIGMFQRWVEAGSPEGDPVAVPRPTWSVGWQVGEPDLVITLPEYTVPAAGETDLYRNFVIDVPGDGVRYVRGLEFRPGSPHVHHANIFIDRTDTSRRLDAEDPLPGYTGLVPHSATFPDGHFLGWTPGQAPPPSPDGLAWRLDAGSSLLVQLHLQASGKPERIRPSIGLFFARTAPTRTPAILRLGRQDLDIPAGARAYAMADQYSLPVDAEVHAVQLHAHHRAREVRAWAELPDGTRRWLIVVSQWDFKWQDQYRYAKPFWLPAGTLLRLEYVYDNSADNPRNPDSPPRRIVWGFRSSDEMGDLWIQFLTRSEPDREVLVRDADRKMTAESIVGLETQIAVRPEYVATRNDAALLYLRSGQPERAVTHFLTVRDLEPRSAPARFNLATALHAASQPEAAIREIGEAIRLDPDYIRAHNALAQWLLLRGQPAEAISHFRDVVRLEPEQAVAQYNLGAALLEHGQPGEAVPPLQRALALKRSFPEAHYNLARAMAGLGRVREAIDELRHAVALRADWPEALAQLSWLLATASDSGLRNPEDAVKFGLKAADLTDRLNPSVLDSLAAAYAARGQFDEAVTVAERAGQLAASDPILAAQIRARLQLYRQGKPVVVP